MSKQNDEHEQVSNQDPQETQEDASSQATSLTLEAFYADAKQRIRYVIHQGEP